MRYSSKKIFTLSVLCCGISSVFAATPIELNHQSSHILQSFVSPQGMQAGSMQSDLQQTSQKTDFNQTTHIRIQQMFSGYPVWGADAVIHVPKGSDASFNAIIHGKQVAKSLDGTVYQGLAADLSNAPTYIFSKVQRDKSIQQAEELYTKKTSRAVNLSKENSKMMVYVDDNNKAHWVFLVSFYAKNVNARPQKPTYILDAITLKQYEYWDDIKTVEVENAEGGGFGGNPKMVKFTYDGTTGNYPKLMIQRDPTKKLCYLKNSDVTVKDMRKNNAVIYYACNAMNPEHNNTYWDGDEDASRGAYSPGNDALFVGKVIKNMYQDWYNVPVLTENGAPMMLNMRVHDQSGNADNAYWDGREMTFGDGESFFYPLVSIGVGAHEISHGFTEQHSNLIYTAQSGGLNESFSDMAAQAAEFYANGHSTWQIGSEVVKQDGISLRYMDQPTKDCNGRKPGNYCSIDNAKDFKSDLNVHYSSGVYNKAFYLLSTAPGWDTRKAFNAMVQANSFYWTSRATFLSAACGVMKATHDFKYDDKAVAQVMSQVGIDVAKC